MSTYQLNGSGAQHALSLWCGRVWERSRVEWHLGSPGDPLRLLADFLADSGLPVDDLTAAGAGAGAAVGPAAGDAGHRGSRACGALVYLSAAAGATVAGVPPGRPSPAPAVPDLVAVAYDHRAPAHPPPPRRGDPPEAGDWWVGDWRASWSPAQHAAAVRAVRSAIARGDAYQVNLVGHAAAPYLGDPRAALRRVASLPGARYPQILAGAGWAIGCASPETLVELTGGRVATRPIKGTRPATPAGRAALATSAKERAEHVMIVDLERNDLARVARTGSVTVDALYTTRRWCDLWQAESEISAELAPGVGLVDLLRAVWPGGSVTGAPKLAALELIAALEPVGRGASMGALGWVGAGRLDLGLTIRTVAFDADRVHVWAGGGITWGSEPDAEVAEAAAKAGPLRRAVEGGLS
jgi:para-aminobenzoate synthetase component 1